MRFTTVLAVLAAAVLWSSPAQAADARLSLKPDHGAANASFQVTLQGLRAPNGECSLANGIVQFRWDGRPLGSGFVMKCEASFTARPLIGRNSPGKHRVTAVFKNKDGRTQSASAGFTVDPAAKPTPTRKASAKPKPSASPTPEPSEITPSASDTPAPITVDDEPIATKETSNTSWVFLGFGGVLVLIGAGLLVWLIRGRKSDEDENDIGILNDETMILPRQE